MKNVKTKETQALTFEFKRTSQTVKIVQKSKNHPKNNMIFPIKRLKKLLENFL